MNDEQLDLLRQNLVFQQFEKQPCGQSLSLYELMRHLTSPVLQPE